MSRGQGWAALYTVLGILGFNLRVWGVMEIHIQVSEEGTFKMRSE